MSVIIPVYNLEKYIERCVNSLLCQTHPFSKIEVILINDGSEDNSELECRKLAQRYDNIKVISKENQGVSAARNDGIKSAQGRYIMFIDGDDTISSETIASLVTFFDANFDKVDLITYNLIYINEKNELSSHERYEILNRSGIYDIDYNIHITQTTMNICVKNSKTPVLFDSTLKVAEDQFFITDWIMKKHKIGFTENADYFYFRHSDASSSTGNHPYICFDQMIYFFDGLYDKYRDSKGKPSRVAQALVLYNLNWRLKADLIWPYHLQGKEMQEAREKIASYIKAIDDDVILSSPYLDNFHKYYFLKFKEKQCNICFAPQRFAIYSGDVLWADESNCLLVFTSTRVKDSKLVLEGFLKSPACEFFDVDVYAHINGEKRGIKLETSLSFYSAYKSAIVTNNFRHFRYKADLATVQTISFSVDIMGHRYSTKFFFAGSSLFLQKNNAFISDKYVIRYRDYYDGRPSDYFNIERPGKEELAAASSEIERSHFQRSKGGAVYRKLIRKKCKPIWLYNDRHGVIDNAYYQFKHDFGKDDGVTRYYVIDNDEINSELFSKEERKYLIKYGSLKHKLKFLNCSKVLTSFSSVSVYSPFPTVQLLAYYGDASHFEIVYLQHGILHAKLVNLYAKERCVIDKIVVSSHFEIENMINNYGYAKEDLIPSGMPRYDYEKVDSVPEGKILFSPSWRRNLIGELVENRRQLNEKAFLNSDFYKQIDAFLNSPRLAKLLNEYDLSLDFKNHPVFEEYNRLFQPKSSRVNIISGSIEMDKYNVMITDYSSIVFDFVYLKRPVIYFVPDYEMFRSGLTHTYRELDLPLEEGFGAFTRNSDELLDELEKLVLNGFEPDEIYKKRMDSFFITKEKHCEKLYNYLSEN